jgi:hypothetical protein
VNERAAPTPEGDAGSQSEPPGWTKDQFNEISYAFTSKRPLVCPHCSGPVLTKESPGQKRTTIVTFYCPRCRVGARAPFRVIDPRDFIQPPFLTCPKCRGAEFGVLMVHGDNYTRRCRNRECWHTVTLHLPRPKKAVIYLDQHIISDMMKVLHPGSKPDRAERAAYARRVFEVLDRAVKLQLVICPNSHIHTRESMVAPDFKALERMYEQLSNKVSFREVWDINLAQVVEHAVNWLRGEPSKPSELTAQDVVDGDLHGWHDRLLIGVAYQPEADTIDLVRARREHIYGGLTNAYQHWASISEVNFDVYRAEMVTAFRHGVIKDYEAYWLRRRAIEAGQIQPTDDDWESPLCVRLLHETAKAFRGEGLPRQVAEARSWEYFASGDHSAVPFIRLDSLLTAALAWQFAHGRTTALGRGTTNDLSAIVHFLPYCDAMYVDGEMHALLSDARVARELGYGTRVFSRRNCDEFVAYVERLIDDAPAPHLARVRSVYGERCDEPFTTMFEPREET